MIMNQTRSKRDRYIHDPIGYLHRRISVDQKTGCWHWNKATNKSGYGVININDGERRTVLAHRLSYELTKGEIPDGAFVCHSCDTPDCINPDHLFHGSAADNNDDKRRKGREPSGDLHWQKQICSIDVAEIKVRRQCGETQAGIAALYGVSQSVISEIVNNKSRSDGVAL